MVIDRSFSRQQDPIDLLRRGSQPLSISGRRGTPGSVSPGYARSPLVRQSTRNVELLGGPTTGVAGQFRIGEFEAGIMTAT